MYNELSYSAKEVAISLAIYAATGLGGLAVKHEAENRGLSEPLPKLLGAGAAVATFMLAATAADVFSPSDDFEHEAYSH